MLKVFEAFSGYGSQSIALERLNIEHEVVGISEIDKNAIKAYYALHSGDIPNFGDISKINPEDLPEFDLFTYSFPCQSLSLSGKLEGLERGKTRSGLLYECEKIIEHCKPKYLLMENVKNLLGKKFRPQFQEWMKYLQSLGYSNQCFVLDAKDFGVPQSRERVFLVSVLNEPIYLTLEKKELNTFIYDIVDENDNTRNFIKEIPELKGAYMNGAYRGRKKDGKYVQNLEFRGDYCSNTITTVQKDNVVVLDGKVGYLTPKECFKLMGLNDEEIEKISKAVSKSAQYKLAGNSIVVDVLVEIFRPWFLENGQK